jgi:hypothetical protein
MKKTFEVSFSIVCFSKVKRKSSDGDRTDRILGRFFLDEIIDRKRKREASLD